MDHPAGNSGTGLVIDKGAGDIDGALVAALRQVDGHRGSSGLRLRLGRRRRRRWGRLRLGLSGGVRQRRGDRNERSLHRVGVRLADVLRLGGRNRPLPLLPSISVVAHGSERVVGVVGDEVVDAVATRTLPDGTGRCSPRAPPCSRGGRRSAAAVVAEPLVALARVRPRRGVVTGAVVEAGVVAVVGDDGRVAERRRRSSSRRCRRASRRRRARTPAPS